MSQSSHASPKLSPSLFSWSGNPVGLFKGPLASGQLSLQSHNYREESWYVISGKVEVLRGPAADSLDEIKNNLERFELSAGDNIFIPVKHVHTMRNLSGEVALVLEVSGGDYKEDDIVRYEDIYGRIKDA